MCAASAASAQTAAQTTAQTEAGLRQYFEGRRVAVKVDMPATKGGVNVHPERPQPLDYGEYARKLKHHGTSIRRGDEALVTKVKVKGKHVEFQLDGGGYGTAGDEAPVVAAPVAARGKRERRLEEELKKEADPLRRRELKEELDGLRREREREDALNQMIAEQTEEAQRARIERKALQGGSRFNVHYGSAAAAAAATPEALMRALDKYVDFSQLAAADAGRAGPAGGATLPAGGGEAAAEAPDSGERGLRLEAGAGAAALPEQGKYFALVVGNNAYENIRKLETAEEDAREVERTLREQYGFETRLLLNATRQQIISALNAYRRELGPEASLLVYYAGHGLSDRAIDRTYWLPVDARPDDNANWISADDITSNIKGIAARHVLIVSDSCYSGTLTRAVEAPAAGAVGARGRYLQKMFAGKSRTLMASGGNEPVLDGGGGRHSVFAGALLHGLSRIDRDQFTAAELFRGYVEESVAGRAAQTPEYNPLRNSGHESGDFVFVRRREPSQEARRP